MNLKLTTALSAAALTAAGAASAQEINIWTLTFSAERANQSFAKIEADFEAANPGVDIVYTFRAVDEHKKALRIAAGSDSGPDIFFSWAGLGLGGDYVNAGMSLPLDQYYEEYGWNDILIPTAAAWADIYEGGKHGTPYTFKAEVMYYKKSLFEQVGITEEPQTYEELIAAADKLKEAGIPAFTAGGSVNWHVMRLMDVLLETVCGAEKHDALVGMDLDWSTEPCAVESFTEMEKWADEYFLKPFMGIDHRQSYDLFKADRAAMMLEGNWLVSNLINDDIMDDVGIFPFPTGQDRLYGFAEYHYVNSKTEHPDIVAKFLDFFMSTEVQQEHLGSFATNSINSEVVYEGLAPLQNEWNAIFGEYDAMFVNGDQGFPAVIVPEYFRVINEVVSDTMSPQEAADALQAFINDNK